MSPLGQFMNQLLQHHKGEVIIVNDNASLTTKQKAAKLKLTRDSWHSNSNCSTNRWEMDGSNHSSAEMRSIISSLTFPSTGPTAPIRKPSKDPPQYSSTPSSDSAVLSAVAVKAEKRLHNYIAKNSSKTKPFGLPSNQKPHSSPSFSRNKGRSNPKQDALVVISVTTSPNTPEPSPTPPAVVVSLSHIKPSQQPSPSPVESPMPSSLELNRSLSKTLGVADVNPQAPKLPTRRPSNQAYVYSPNPPASSDSSSSFAYSQMVCDISLSPLNASGDKSLPCEVSKQLTKKSSLEPPISSKRSVFPKLSAGKWLNSLAKRK